MLGWVEATMTRLGYSGRALPMFLRTAATVFDLYGSRALLTASDLPMFALGFAVSFVAAWFAVRFFLRLLAVTTLRPFGWYRIAAALGLLLAISAGWFGL